MTNYVGKLNELASGRQEPYPNYIEGKVTDRFVIKCQFLNNETVGFGVLKKDAKQDSAGKMLQLIYTADKPIPVQQQFPLVNYVGKLNELASGRQQPYPTYIEGKSTNGGFIIKCLFLNNESVGSGAVKMEAKQDSAKKMLQKVDKPSTEHTDLLQNTNIYITDSNQLVNIENHVDNCRQFENTLKTTSMVNYVGKLNELAAERQKPYPSYVEGGITNGKFTIRCIFMGNETVGHGVQKKEAKQNSAEKMLLKIDQGVNLSVEGIQDDLRKCTLLSTREIVEKYKEVEKQDLHVNNNHQHHKYDDMSLDNFNVTMDTLGLKFDIKTFQVEPCIMELTIQNSRFVLMAYGDTKDQALNNLLYKANLVISSGFKLKTLFTFGQ